MNRRWLVVLLILLLSSVSMAQEDEPDLTRLPVGDGKISDEPQQGYIWVCANSPNNPNAGGAQAEGPWFNGDGTYNLLEKLTADGEVTWSWAFEITVEGDQRVFTGNGLPNHPTGVYPVQANDDVYVYDRNPNRISEQTIEFDLPANPQVANQPTCMTGSAGIMITGSLLFNGLDAENRDAVAHEAQDACHGHPERTGQYHYHSATPCIDEEAERAEDQHSTLIAYALDGFGIYGVYGEDGEIMTNEKLDECHGHTHEVEWDGEVVEMYHYHATYEYPYTIGCYRGTPVRIEAMMGGGQQPPANGQGQQPPPGGQGQQPPPGGQGQQPPPPRP